ncbi:MAG: hypothetical protein IAF94_04845 [Pirellulaceae bacterium]|nr:hypothetical protein [Pirellulaceae bacterium]
MAPRGLAGMVCLAVGLAATVSGRTCQAGCGEYVFVRNASGQLVRASSLMKDHNDNPQGAQTPVSPIETFPIKVPCQGPNCSNRSQLPTAPVPPTAPQRSVQESTALLLKLNSRDDDAGARFGFFAGTNDHELHYSQSIFHPPR